MELREGGVEGVVSEVTGIQYESTPCDTHLPRDGTAYSSVNVINDFPDKTK